MVRTVSLEELPSLVDKIDNIMKDDYNEAIRLLSEFQLKPWQPKRLDPFSDNYCDWVRSVYLKITGNAKYAAEVNEADRNITTDMPLKDFFPFLTADTQVVGNYLAGIAHIMRHLDIPARSRIVEYGVGWGHVSFLLARTGHEVACVDIEAKFLKLVERQAAAFGMELRTHAGEFGESPYADPDERADAAIFFEAFHHALNHAEVVRRLRTEVLRPGGVLLLAAEPIHRDFPVPWGVRHDGHALWAVRTQGWMELGFSEDYLVELMLRNGFLVTRAEEPGLGSFGILYRCQQQDTSVELGRSVLPAADAASWAVSSPDERRLWAQKDSAVSLDSTPEWKSVSLRLRNFLPAPVSATISITGGLPRPLTLAPGEVRDVIFGLAPGRRRLRIASQTFRPVDLGAGLDERSLGIALEHLSYSRSNV